MPLPGWRSGGRTARWDPVVLELGSRVDVTPSPVPHLSAAGAGHHDGCRGALCRRLSLNELPHQQLGYLAQGPNHIACHRSPRWRSDTMATTLQPGAEVSWALESRPDSEFQPRIWSP